MGQILFSGGNGGLVSSDELTANTNYVLEGKTYMGSDTDDEAGTGTMKNVAAIDYGPSLAVSGSNLYCRMTNGAHIQNASPGYPEVAYSLDKVRTAINYTDANKVLNDTTICGMTGTMPNQGTWDSSVGVNSSITIPRGYHSGKGKVSNSVATMGAQTITPSHSKQTINCSGKYMTGNITVNATNIFKSWEGTANTSTNDMFGFGSYSGSTSANLRYYYADIYPSGFNYIYMVAWKDTSASGNFGYMLMQNAYSGYFTASSGAGTYYNKSGAFIFTNTHIRFPVNTSSGHSAYFWLCGY